MTGPSAADIIAMSEDRDINEKGGRLGNRGGGRGRGRSRGGRGGGEGSGRGEMSREVAVSKALSKLLRHAAEEAGLSLDAEGFARLDEVMNWQRLKSLHVKFTDIRAAVTDNAKQRFSMKPNPALPSPPAPTSENPSDWVIRANQGHSIAMDSSSLLTPITVQAGNVPDVVVHGTFHAFWQAIVQSGGLKRMGRNHIHFSTGLPEDGDAGVISGMRGDAELLVYIDIKKSLQDGHVKWWMSENGVVLTEGDENGMLASRYFSRVEGRRKADCGILWEDGVEVVQLPLALRSRKAPIGKGTRGSRGRQRGARGGGAGTGTANATRTKELDDKGGNDLLEASKS